MDAKLQKLRVLVPTYAVKTPTGTALIAARNSLEALNWAKLRWGESAGPYSVDYAPPRLVASYVENGATVYEVPADFHANKS